MDNLIDIIIDKFGLDIESVVKDRSCYIIKTDDGSFIAKKSVSPKEHILFQHKVKEFLCEDGFCNIDRFVLTREENPLPFFSRGDELITVSKLYPFREADFTYLPDALKVSETLGLLHRTTEKYDFVQAGRFFSHDIAAEYEKGIAFLQSIKKTLTAGKNISDFDITVAKNYDFYLKRAEEAVKLLSELYRGRSVICHNLVKEENFLLNDEEIYITEFSKISAASPVFDLSQLIGRIIKSSAKNEEAGIISVKQLINSYVKFGDFDENDAKKLYASLIYPKSFIKSCMNFYNKKRTFVPVSVKNKLDQIIEVKQLEQSCIEQILSL